MPTYENAPDSLLAHWRFRRVPLNGGPLGGLPPLDADLRPLRDERVPPPPDPAPPPPTRLAAKLADLRRELAGCSGLALVNGLLIAHLRKEAWPDHAPALFRRLWAEEAAHLLADLPMRWRISSAITFATHGATEAERRLGQSLNVLFSLVKLYESERTHTGLAAHEPFRVRHKGRPALPMGLPGFALVQGKLDIEFLAPLWAEALVPSTLAPLAQDLLARLNDDEGTLFARIAKMRAETVARRAARAEARARGQPLAEEEEAEGDLPAPPSAPPPSGRP
jgi:hypothetical protein